MSPIDSKKSMPFSPPEFALLSVFSTICFLTTFAIILFKCACCQKKKKHVNGNNGNVLMKSNTAEPVPTGATDTEESTSPASVNKREKSKSLKISKSLKSEPGDTASKRSRASQADDTVIHGRSPSMCRKLYAYKSSRRSTMAKLDKDIIVAEIEHTPPYIRPSNAPNTVQESLAPPTVPESMDSEKVKKTSLRYLDVKQQPPKRSKKSLDLKEQSSPLKKTSPNGKSKRSGKSPPGSIRDRERDRERTLKSISVAKTISKSVLSLQRTKSKEKKPQPPVTKK